jgi:hypothetical protein
MLKLTIPEIATLNTSVTQTQNGPYKSGLGRIDRLKKSVVDEGRGNIDHKSLNYRIVFYEN